MRLRTKLGASLATVVVVGAATGIAIGVSGVADATTVASDATWGPEAGVKGAGAVPVSR